MLAQATSTAEGSPIVGLLFLVAIIAIIAAMWSVFAKAEEPGWAAIVPIYNLVVEARIAGKGGGWVFAEYILGPFGWLFIRPTIGIGVAKSFGRSAAFGVGIGLLPFLFYPILALDGSKYRADAVPRSATVTAS